MLITNKTRVVQIRLVDADYQKLKKLAKESQLTMSEYLRRLIVNK